jgi:hypothetical protein
VCTENLIQDACATTYDIDRRRQSSENVMAKKAKRRVKRASWTKYAGILAKEVRELRTAVTTRRGATDTIRIFVPDGDPEGLRIIDGRRLCRNDGLVLQPQPRPIVQTLDQ